MVFFNQNRHIYGYFRVVERVHAYLMGMFQGIIKVATAVIGGVLISIVA